MNMNESDKARDKFSYKQLSLRTDQYASEFAKITNIHMALCGTPKMNATVQAKKESKLKRGQVL